MIAISTQVYTPITQITEVYIYLGSNRRGVTLGWVTDRNSASLACPPPMLAEGHFLPPPQYFEVGGKILGAKPSNFGAGGAVLEKFWAKFRKIVA